MSIAGRLTLRRGTTQQHEVFTGAEGEITVDTDKDTIVVHDGVTVGGHVLAKDDSKADKSNTYTEQEVNDLLDTKANADVTYTKEEVSNLLDGKANANVTYTESEVNDLLDLKANAAEVDALLDDKATNSELEDARNNALAYSIALG